MLRVKKKVKKKRRAWLGLVGQEKAPPLVKKKSKKSPGKAPRLACQEKVRLAGQEKAFHGVKSLCALSERTGSQGRTNIAAIGQTSAWLEAPQKHFSISHTLGRAHGAKFSSRPELDLSSKRSPRVTVNFENPFRWFQVG